MKLPNKQYEKNCIYWLKKELANTRKRITELNNQALDYYPASEKNTPWFLRQFIPDLEQEIKDLNRQLWKLTKPEFNGTLDVERAKQVPITEILIFRNNKTKCLWHEDKHPSLSYHRKRNCVHCFVCDKDADSIDVVMEFMKLDFKSAVKYLTQ
jgi:hypothetical protein